MPGRWTEQGTSGNSTGHKTEFQSSRRHLWDDVRRSQKGEIMPQTESGIQGWLRRKILEEVQANSYQGIDPESDSLAADLLNWRWSQPIPNDEMIVQFMVELKTRVTPGLVAETGDKYQKLLFIRTIAVLKEECERRLQEKASGAEAA